MGAAVLSAGAFSCDDTPKPQATGGVLTIRAAHSALVGATVLVDGERHELRSGGASDPAFVVVKLPKMPEDPPPIELELPSPCGPLRVATNVTTAERFPNQLKVNVSVAKESAPSEVAFWIDPAAGDVEIGATRVKAPKGTIERLDCGERLDVKVGGKVVGQLDGKDARPIFVPRAADACYRLATLAFGKYASNVEPVVLRGAGAYRLSEKDVRFFLEPPPESVSAPAWSQGVHLVELQSIPCP
jgi:hypothetical protein